MDRKLLVLWLCAGALVVTSALSFLAMFATLAVASRSRPMFEEVAHNATQGLFSAGAIDSDRAAPVIGAVPWSDDPAQRPAHYIARANFDAEVQSRWDMHFGNVIADEVPRLVSLPVFALVVVGVLTAAVGLTVGFVTLRLQREQEPWN